MHNLGTMKQLTLLLVMLTALSCFAQTRPTPFGFHIGWTREQTITAIGGKTHIKFEQGSAVIFDAAPSATNGFDDFSIMFATKEGLAKVLAAVKVPTNRSGEQVREKYAGIRSGLVAKYGKPDNDSDFVHAGALWSSNTEFTMALLKGERTLECLWTLSDGTKIMLSAVGFSSEEVHIYLIYEFHPEFDAYVAEKEKQEKDAY